MTRINLGVSVLALSAALPATGQADSYDYAIGFLYDTSHASNAAVFTGPGGLILFETETDVDELGLVGTWYFDGVQAAAGPRSRAAFISRASGVSVRYARGSGETVLLADAGNPVFPSSVERAEQSSGNLSADLRWVGSGGGWYGLAGVSIADFDQDSGFASVELSTTDYRLGLGKYVGEQTAVDLSIVRRDADASGAVIGGNSTSTDVAVGLTHIGDLGRAWQYGTDVVLSTSGRGSSDGSYGLRLSLFPSRPIAFGFEADGALQDPGDASTSYGVFASWFPRERIELEARYGWVSLDEPSGIDLEQYRYGAGVNFRF